MNSYLEIEQDDFDLWLRSTWEHCGDNESCYELVWQQIIKKIGQQERESITPDYAIRVRDFLAMMVWHLINPIRNLTSTGKTK